MGMRFFPFHEFPFRNSKVDSSGAHTELPFYSEAESMRGSGATSPLAIDVASETLTNTNTAHITSSYGTVTWANSYIQSSRHSGYVIGQGQAVGEAATIVDTGTSSTSEWNFLVGPRANSYTFGNVGTYVDGSGYPVSAKYGEGVCSFYVPHTTYSSVWVHMPFILVCKGSGVLRAMVSHMTAWSEYTQYYSLMADVPTVGTSYRTDLAVMLHNTKAKTSYHGETQVIGDGGTRDFMVTWNFKVPTGV